MSYRRSQRNSGLRQACWRSRGSDVSYIGEDLPFAWKDEESLLLLVCDKGATGLWEAVLNAETGKYEVGACGTTH